MPLSERTLILTFLKSECKRLLQVPSTAVLDGREIPSPFKITTETSIQHSEKL